MNYDMVVQKFICRIIEKSLRVWNGPGTRVHLGCSNSKKTVAPPIGGRGGTHSHDSSLHTFLARRNAVMTFLFPQRGGTTLSSLHTFTARRNRGRSFFWAEGFSIACISYKTGVFPDFFKISRITPIFKKGAKNLKSNYRPISSLEFWSKIFERWSHFLMNQF